MTSFFKSLSVTIFALFFALPAYAEPVWLDDSDAVAIIINNQANEIGKSYIKKGSGGVMIYIDLEKGSLPAGPRGMHFHKVGDCSDHDHFKNAQGHIDPHAKPHGFLNPEGPHEGNLPNLIVHEDGSAQVELYSTLVTISDGDAAILDEDGSTLIVHENTDDHYTQPIGGAGGRLACGLYEPITKE